MIRRCLLAALSGLSLAGCANDEPPKEILRLWKDVAPRELITNVATNVAPLVDFPLSTSFDTSDGVRLYRVVQWGDALTHRPMQPVDGSLVLAPEELLAGLVLIDVEPGDALEITASIRSEGEDIDHAIPFMAAVELKQPLEPGARLTAEDVRDLLDDTRSGSYVVSAVPREVAQRVTIKMVVDQQTEELALYFPAPWEVDPERLLVDSVQVERQPLVDYFAAGGDVPRVERLEAEWAETYAGPVRVQFDRDEREGLVMTPGTTYEFEIPPSDVPRRLDVACGLRESHAPGRARFGISLDGASLLDEVYDTPTSIDIPAWHDHSLDLPISPVSQTLTFKAGRVSGSAPLVVFGNPTVHLRRAEATPRPNVVLISLDTLRPDRLGAYGHDEAITPNLDALADDGWTFTRAYSTSSYTLPSHGSMLTGLYPAYHGAVDVTDSLDAERTPFLARQLADAGYVTAAFTGGGYVGTTYGFGEGFDRYSLNDPIWAYDTLRGQMLIKTMSWRRVPMQMDLLRRYGEDAVTDFIGAQDEHTPFFLFVHSFIVHNYAPSKPWLDHFDLYNEYGLEEAFNHKAREAFNEGDESVDVADVYDDYMPYYDATVSMADEFVGAVVAALERAGLADNTMIIVTSDHGEEFGEHDVFGHGVTLYDNNTRIPLIARLPKSVRALHEAAVPPVSGPGSEVSRLVSLVDVAPWVLRTAGLVPDPRMVLGGADAPLDGSEPGRTRLFIELDTHVSRKSAVVRDSSKLLVHLEDARELLEDENPRLFDVVADPGETFSRGAVDPALARDLRGTINELHAVGSSLHPRDGTPLDLSSLDPETRATLRALGYLDGLDDADKR